MKTFPSLAPPKAGQILRSKIAFNFLTSTILTHFNLTNLNLFVPYKVEAHHLARGFAKSNRDGGKSINLEGGAGGNV